MGTWADRVRSLRRALRVTQERFAQLIDASFTSVNRWEAGRAEPAEHASFLELLETAIQRRAADLVVRVLGRAVGSRRGLIRALVWLADEGPPPGAEPASSPGST